MMKEIVKKLKICFPHCWEDDTALIVLMASALDICFLLKPLNGSDGLAQMVFILAVLLISCVTQGYLYGMIASIASFFAVNYFFTFPYYTLNFSLIGYPLTFATFIIVSIVGSTMTNILKEGEKIRTQSEQDHLRANLLRALGHDLRTPLTSISGSASLLLEQGKKMSRQDQENLLQNVREEADWLMRMVENLLSITRFGGGAENLIKKPAAAEELLGEAIENFQKYYSSVEVNAHVPEDLLMVDVDAMLIEQVLFNLLQNAVIHGKAKRIDLKIQLKKKQVVFYVQDNGIGLPNERLEYLFEDKLADKMTDRKNGEQRHNLGIGLPICRAIIMAHGGQIGAYNSPNGGAVLWFALPAGRENNYND